MPTCVKNLFLLICLLVLPLAAICQCPEITVNNISQPSSGSTVCDANGDPSLITGSVPMGGTGSYVYKWQESTDNINFTDVKQNGSSLNYDPPAITTTTYYRRLVTSTNFTCSVSSLSNVITITVVTGTPVLNNTIAQPTPDSHFCTASATPSIMVGSVATGAGTISYQWQRSFDNSTFFNINGATGQNYTPPPLNATTYFRRAVLSTACIIPSVSNVITIIVTPSTANQITVPIDELNWCGPSKPAAMTGAVQLSDGYNFQWQLSTDNINFTDIPGANAQNYAPPNIITQTTSYRRVISVSECSITIVSNVITISISPLTPITNNSISQPVPDPVFCSNNADPSVINGSTPVSIGTLKYQWQQSTDNTNFTNITGAKDISYDPKLISVTTYYRRVVTTTNCVPPSYSNVITITILPVISSNDIKAPSVISYCGTGDADLITGNSVTGNGFAYQWQSSADGTNFTDIPGAISNDYDPPALNQTTYYRRIITSNGCNAPSISSVVKISVDALPVASISDPVTICEGASTTLTASGGAKYQWVPSTGLSDANVASPVATPSKSTSYLVTITNGGCAVLKTVQVTVITKSKVDAGSDKNILKGDKIQLNGSVKSDTSAVQYSWSPTTYLSDPTVLNPVANPTEDITYTLTATTLNGCFVVSDEVTVKVFEKVIIPNTFTPNNDGINDTWDIIGLSSYTNSQLNIYNRNGMQIFKSTGYPKSWDGTYNGKLLPMGTYYYVIDLKNGSKAMSGWVSVVK